MRFMFWVSDVFSPDLGDTPVLALGTPGSYCIPQPQSQAMVHYLDYGLDLQASIDAPRGRLWDGRKVNLEDRVPAETVAGLRERGHDVHMLGAFSWSAGGMQAEIGRAHV